MEEENRNHSFDAFEAANWPVYRFEMSYGHSNGCGGRSGWFSKYFRDNLDDLCCSYDGVANDGSGGDDDDNADDDSE